MKKIISLLFLLFLITNTNAQIIVHIEQPGPDSIKVIPMVGNIQLESGKEILPFANLGTKQSFQIKSESRISYIRIIRAGSYAYLPVIQGEQTYRFLNSVTNEYQTDNLFQLEYLLMETRAKNFLLPYQDSSKRLNPDIRKGLPDFIDSLNRQIKNHAYEFELRATFIQPMEYSIYEKTSDRRSMKKFNASKIKEVNENQVLFGCWAYNKFLNTLLKDYFNFTMTGFDYPFRKYKPASLENFVFKHEVFTQKELVNYLSFYKIKHLEFNNDKTLLFHLADSLLTLTSDPALKSEIESYIGKSQTRVQPQVKAPDFLLKQIGSSALVKRSDFEGNVLILDFWATWCGPCVKSFKSIKSLNQTYKDSVQFVSISLDDNAEMVEEFLKRNSDYTWTFLFDGKNGATGIVYEAMSIPKYIIIDEAGIIVKEFYSIKDVEEWLEKRF